MKTLKLISIAIVAASTALAVPAMASDVAAGQKIAEGTCNACHGAQGNKPTMDGVARLAGQHEDYLLKALKDYKSGARKNPIMGSQVAELSKQDLQNVAAYYAQQKDGLKLK